MDFFRTPRGLLALAVFIAGTGFYSAPSMAATARDIPWEYMPAAVANASWKFYEVNFIPLAEIYLDGVDQVGDLQANSYALLGKGMSLGITAAAESKPVAAAAEWYVTAERNVEARFAR